MSYKGAVWNESEAYLDPITRRPCRKLTKYGIYNMTPTYHTNHGFSADGRFVVFSTGRGGRSVALKANCETGELTQLTEWVDGLGGRDELHKLNGTGIGTGNGVAGIHMSLAPNSGWCCYVLNSSLLAVNIHTLEERVLIADFGSDWIGGIPSISPDETEVLLPTYPPHPQLAAGQVISKTYMQCLNEGLSKPVMRVLRVPLAGGPWSIFYQEEGVISAHIPHNPGDPDIVLFDRDTPPSYWSANGKDEVSRCWTYNARNGELKPLRARNARSFQVHSVWTFDGSAMLYHGPAAEGGWYIGAITRDGETISEYTFPEYKFYGHVAADPVRKAVIIDGNLSPDLLMWVHYGEATPRIEIIARHGTEWGGLPGQYSHVHPMADPTGRFISMNVARGGRTDVHIVQVG